MKPVTALIIMDGFGLTDASPTNAISVANTPVLDNLFEKYPHTEISASGGDVGLPDGQIGNSEVGHTNIGAGRIVYQDLSLITREIETGRFFDNPEYLRAVEGAKNSGRALHLMGLMSPGGVHSHIDHLWAFLELAKSRGLEKLYIHCFMDGRDTPPCSGIESVKAIVKKCADLGVGRIATVMGRFYAMYRDKRWERVELAYNALVCGEGEFNPDPVDAMERSYAAGVTDEFVKPVICDRQGLVSEGDSIIFINFRPDRAREITRAF
ncbi:MAG: phosphoglycerate mutase (2,3-diphosphoglycerate-independent), partial [Oscillospiraceae bacterium]|nr:phosphoglycerate mutase (2,3-diphosphoglycerate-independent) [Oscillospiraceae bacterium]